MILPEESTLVAVNGSSVEIRFRITEDIPQVYEGDVSRNATSYDGEPLLSFNFTINGSELVFFVSSVDLYEDEGNYTVFASNPAGHTESTIFLDVQSEWLH